MASREVGPERFADDIERVARDPRVGRGGRGGIGPPAVPSAGRAAGPQTTAGEVAVAAALAVALFQTLLGLSDPH